jgi:hypothetical protein
LGANADNKFVNGFFGNDASAISNVFSGADPGSAAMGLAITNPTDYNAISIGVKAVGMIPNPFASQRVLLGTTSSGAYFGKEVVTPTLAESLLGDVAGGIFAEFTVGKLILDTATYGAGLVSCKLNGQ